MSAHQVKGCSHSELVSLNTEAVKSRLLALRGQMVLLDRDVAALYGVATREINQAIRNNPALAPTRVIVVTADVEMRTKAVKMGFDDILLKPVTRDSLAKALAGEVESASQAG